MHRASRSFLGAYRPQNKNDVQGDSRLWREMCSRMSSRLINLLASPGLPGEVAIRVIYNRSFMPRVSVLAKTPAIWRLIAGITLVGCHSYSPAKPDPPKAQTTSIEGAADGVLVGERAQLRIVVSSNAGTRQLENVVWSSDRPDIVDINSTGTAVGL